MNKRIFFGELLGTFFLLSIIVGSGIMGEKLFGGAVGLTLLVNSISTGTGLIVLIWMFGSSSGAHFNPLVSFSDFFKNRLSKIELRSHLIGQAVGAISGVIVTHVMFGEKWISFSVKDRGVFSLILSEVIATFGLILVIRLVGTYQKENAPIAIGLYITSAYWFTSSTSFANPVVSIARSLTGTFTGISIGDLIGFLAAQIVGGICAEVLFTKIFDIGET